jgi:hypothetical protein
VPAALILQRSRTVAALQWGIQLGLGFRTYVVTPAFFGLISVGLVQDPIALAVAVGTLYGIVRGGMIATFAIAAAWGAVQTTEVRLKALFRAPVVIATAISVVTVALSTASKTH